VATTVRARSNPQTLLIAHRGACGYLPEHTLEAKALAYGMGADFLEQDVVASRDDHLVVMHDIHVESVTDIAQHFPARARDDGHYYARDFDLDELKMLNVHERRDKNGLSAVFPRRFPTTKGHFAIATLAEEIEMIQGLNTASGGNVGIYPEIKRPAWHRAHGVDLSRLLLDTLHEFGYSHKQHKVFIQCFDAGELVRLRTELRCEMKLVQLIGENSWGESDTDYDLLQTGEGLQRVAAVAEAIGPWAEQLYTTARIDGQPVSTSLVSAAHAAGLQVHPYTFRADALFPGFESFDAMVKWFVEKLRIDGLFSDFPDLARAALDSS